MNTARSIYFLLIRRFARRRGFGRVGGPVGGVGVRVCSIGGRGVGGGERREGGIVGEAVEAWAGRVGDLRAGEDVEVVVGGVAAGVAFGADGGAEDDEIFGDACFAIALASFHPSLQNARSSIDWKTSNPKCPVLSHDR